MSLFTRVPLLAVLVLGLIAPAPAASGERRDDGPATAAEARPVPLPSLEALARDARDADASPAGLPAPWPGSRGPEPGTEAISASAAEPGSSRAPVLNPATPSSFSTPSRSYLGTPTTATPPDPIGDVGPDHYVHAVNVSFSIFSKADTTGTPVLGPTPLGTFFAPLGFPCTNNQGDPVVVYDQLPGRWVLAQFARAGVATPPFRLCVGVSDTTDPTASWKLYAFDTGVFPDYFKIGVWPDAYYVAWNQGTVGIAALERTQMLLGMPAEIVRTSVPGPHGANMMLPADADGDVPPPAGSPGIFYHHVDEAVAGGADRLDLRTAVPTFNGAPSSIAVSAPTSIPVAPFDGNFCGGSEFTNCIPQPGTGQLLDPIMEWPMWRLQYRNVGTHEALVGNFLEDVGSVDRAGIRWFELRRTGGGPWTLHQEGTHSPDTTSRWMGSIAMDGAGNIALGYSASDGASTFPSVWYAGRRPTDPPGTLPMGEVALANGDASQTGSNRWGDYSSMNVDPVDDCTFWFTGQYSTSAVGQESRVGAFRLCNALTVALTGPGAGTITSSPGQIACPPVCRGSFNPGTQVTLTPNADKGSFFRGWSAGGCTGAGPCTLTIGGDATVSGELGKVKKRRLAFRAKPRRPSAGQRIRLIVKDRSASGFLGTCDHRRDKVRFQEKDGRWKTIARKRLNNRCKTKIRTVINETTKYRVVIGKQDPDHKRTKKVRRVVI